MIQSYYHKKERRGISTVLGVLFMVGILLTTVIPLFMYVNEVNNYYDRTVANMQIADQERRIEDLEIYAFGHTQSSETIDIFLINRGAISINITRIWIMRKDLQTEHIYNSTNLATLPIQVVASNQMTIENLTVPILENEESIDYFNIEIATERGNKFTSQTNPLHKTAFGWETGSQSFQIQVMVLSDWGLDNFKIEARGADNITSSFYDLVYSSQQHGDFFTVIPVTKAGSYNVTAWKWEGGGYNLKLGESTLILTWAHPSSLRKFNDDT